MSIVHLSMVQSIGKNSCRISSRRGFFILTEFLFSLLILYLLMSASTMAVREVRNERKVRSRIFASYLAEGITTESLSAKGSGLQSVNDAVPSHISSLGSLQTDFQRIDFGRSFLPDIDIMRYTTSYPPGDIVTTSVTWYESGKERTVVVSATL